MQQLTGKTRSILLRLPHFFDPGAAGDLLLQFVEIFGRSLERAETDLYGVLRAHHVQTADNEVTRGYTAPLEKRGDLDKIFTLYLEVLGGTSQLVKVSPAITERSLEPRSLARTLVDDAQRGEGLTPLMAYLRTRLGRATWEVLARYRVEHARVTAGEIQPGFALELLTARADRAADPRAALGEYLRERLSPPTRERLARYDGSPRLDPRLAAGLADDLNRRVLPDAGLYRKHQAYFESLNLPGLARRLRSGIFRELLREQVRAADEEIRRLPERVRAAQEELRIVEEELARPDLADDRRNALARKRRHFRDELLPSLARQEAPLLEGRRWREDALGNLELVPTPPGDDLRRLNRMLLEAAYPRLNDPRRGPSGFRARDIPPLAEVRRSLADALNALLDDPDLYHPDRFPGMEEAVERLRRLNGAGPGLQWMNRMLLEAAFPESVERSFAPYRERLMGLIQVLRRGASTRQGIVDIVAANLGILGDDPEARRARELIEIEEYQPKEISFYTGNASFYLPFQVPNSTPQPVRPELRLLRLKAPFDEIANPRITDLRTGQTVEIPVRMRADDRLLVEGSTVLLNGIPVLGGIETPLPEVPTLGSEWRFDADVVVPGTEAGKEKGAFPVARFDRSVGNNRGTFGSMVLAPSEPVVTLDVSSYKPKPGVFTVVIPWHIPGFTDKFEERDHPRQQIPSLVERVKAAGVRALVAYKMVFAEQHDVHGVLRLGLGGRLFAHDQDARDAMRMESSQSTREVHSVQDELILSGSLDYTSFDSLNTFA